MNHFIHVGQIKEGTRVCIVLWREESPSPLISGL